MEYLLLTAALTLNALANLLLKLGAMRLSDRGGGPGLLLRVATNPYLLLGVALFALNVVFYAAALTRLNLSVAYPVMVAGGIVLVVLASVVWLREPVSSIQFLGLALLVLGIVLVSHRSGP
jgi:multidrug transporter EmrE-like cation transporter